jgi:predicted nucleic acid-binding protein
VSLIAFDSNILLYAELETASAKGKLAERLLAYRVGRSVIAAQALGEAGRRLSGHADRGADRW